MTHVNIFLNLNRYILLDSIGSGSYGSVFKVKDKDYGDIYAAKISKEPVNVETETEQNTVLLFGEVNILASLNHPSILKFIGYSSKDFNKNPYPTLITEFAQKGSLQNILNKPSKYDLWDDTRKLINIYGIASGMNYLHENEIIHRDLKPDNILMNDKLEPKISDFGLSKMADFYKNFHIEKLESKDEKGTLVYMPPEIHLNNAPFTKAGDVYAFGLIMYQIMEDKKVFYEFKTFRAFSIMVENAERPEFSEKTPKPYQNLIVKCWSQNPEERPTFSEILNELKKNEFITEKVDKNAFYEYVSFIDGYNSSFELSKRSIEYGEFIQGFKKMRARGRTVREAPKISFESSSKMSIPNKVVQTRRRSNCIMEKPKILFDTDDDANIENKESNK